MAAEKEEGEFYKHKAPVDWLKALEPLGTDSNKKFLEEAKKEKKDFLEEAEKEKKELNESYKESRKQQKERDEKEKTRKK